MSELEPDRSKTKATAAGAATATNPTTDVTVWFDEKSDSFRYQPPGGNLSFLRKQGDPAKFSIQFKRGDKESWEFSDWHSKGKLGAPEMTPTGKPVLKRDVLQPDIVKVTDLVEWDDPYDYKYTIKIKLPKGQPKEDDPEIQNRREIRQADDS